MYILAVAVALFLWITDAPQWPGHRVSEPDPVAPQGATAVEVKPSGVPMHRASQRTAQPPRPGAFSGRVGESLSHTTAGTVSYVWRRATVMRAGTAYDAEPATPIFAGDRIESSEDSRLECQLGDGSLIVLGELSVLLLDRFHYDPMQLPEQSHAQVTLLRGYCRVTSGLVADLNRAGMTIRTPMGEITLHGCHVAVSHIDGCTRLNVMHLGAGDSVTALASRSGALLCDPQTGAPLPGAPGDRMSMTFVKANQSLKMVQQQTPTRYDMDREERRAAMTRTSCFVPGGYVMTPGPAGFAAAFKERGAGDQVASIQLEGASANAKALSPDKIRVQSVVFSGKDEAKPLSAYADVYPGIDLVYFGDDHEMEMVFVVHPGADPAMIKFAMTGGASAVGPAGDATFSSDRHTLKFSSALSYGNTESGRSPSAQPYTVEGQTLSFVAAPPAGGGVPSSQVQYIHVGVACFFQEPVTAILEPGTYFRGGLASEELVVAQANTVPLVADPFAGMVFANIPASAGETGWVEPSRPGPDVATAILLAPVSEPLSQSPPFVPPVPVPEQPVPPPLQPSIPEPETSFQSPSGNL